MPTIEVTTMVGCPLACRFCPQDQLKSSYGKNEKYLSLENFKLILAKVPDYVRVDFSGMSEPWANPSATKMLAHALQLGFNVGVYTTLYGMTPDDADQVVALLTKHADQVEVVCLHLPDRTGNMRGFRHSAEYEAVLRKFVALGDAGVLRRFEMMTMDAHGMPPPQVLAIVRGVPGWIGNTRAGNLESAEALEPTPRHSSPVSCSFTPFYDHNVLLPNGDVVLCCMDYSVKHKVGNLIDGDYLSIFASRGMSELRAANTAPGHDGRSICKSCSRATTYELALGQKQFWSPIGHLVTGVEQSAE
jgi:Radical SAM superfamily/Iron-sulfur cluster-binding domain